MMYKVYYQRFFHLFPPAEMYSRYLNCTHRFVTKVSAQSLDGVYRQMQSEIWSPQGEARPLIASRHLEHTSLSVGDVVQDGSGDYWVCNDLGWLPLPGSPPAPQPRLWLATLANLHGASPQTTFLKISDEVDCLPPDAFTVESFGWTEFADLVVLAHKLEHYPGFAPRVQVCIDLGEQFYETEATHD